jgi:aminopeptidase N
MALDFTIDPAETEFSGRVHVDAQVVRATNVVWMNGAGLTVQTATLGGQPVRVITAGEDLIGLVASAPLAVGATTIDLAYTGGVDRERSRGLYAVQEGADWYAYTFFEPVDARRAFPCFDEPSYKIPWQLTFHVRADHVARGNAEVARETPEEGGMKRVELALSRPMPSYLVAFVVGPFEIVDDGVAGRAKTPVRFIVPRGRAGELGYAKEVTPKVVAALEDYFDIS